MTYKGDVQTKGSSLILKDIVAVGLITDSFAKVSSFAEHPSICKKYGVFMARLHPI